MSSLRVLAFTQGQNVPSARYRIQQFIPLLQRLDVDMTEVRTRSTAYPPERHSSRLVWATGRSCELLYRIASAPKVDSVIIQREMLSTLSTFERLTQRPRVFDVDDAIHLHRNAKTARDIARACDRVIVGNSYLADVYQAWNSAVTVIPTCVDTENYKPTAHVDRPVTIGWIGTSSNAKYLTDIQPALQRVLAEHRAARFLVISDKQPVLPDLPQHQIEYREWAAAREIADIQSMDIGIMPLQDSAWARGKCSFKMLQYMACGLPVVVSPVGMNAEVLARGNLGYAATTNSQWADALSQLVADADVRQHMGQQGRQVCSSDFSAHAWAPKLRDVLRFQ
jgi:glycosyltransferase involved in cell wall biosynthesis